MERVEFDQWPVDHVGIAEGAAERAFTTFASVDGMATVPETASENDAGFDAAELGIDDFDVKEFATDAFDTEEVATDAFAAEEAATDAIDTDEAATAPTAVPLLKENPTF